jgi:two-component system, OmpR family, sensor histidine kinase KdpD
MGLALRLAMSLGATAALTAVYLGPLPANPTTVALSYVVLVLLVATEWGLVEATVLAVAASVSFNAFFLPPFGTLTIADPENWASFIAFMLTAVVASQLSGRARARRLDALARQRDLERLYALSRGLLLTDAGVAAPAGIARHIADAFDLGGVALYDRHTGTIARAGAVDLPGVEPQLREVARQSVTLRDPSGLVVTAIRLGGAPIGSLAVLGATLSDTVLQSIVNLAAIGLERAHDREASATVDAARRSGELRAALLDAVAHEFKTPLTSIRAAVGELSSGVHTSASNSELVTIIDEESVRLQRLVSDAIQMFRLEAGDLRPHVESQVLAAVVDDVLRDIRPRAGARTVSNHVGAAVRVDADAGLLTLALRQLLDNAVKYSPPAAAVDVSADVGDAVDIVVRNAGPGIHEHERERIFERFYRGADARTVPGTGMGLAIVRQIVQAHGGGVTVSRDDDGTAFRLSLPRVSHP